MTAEPGIYEQLLPMFGLCEFEEENASREIVDVGQAQRYKAFGKLMCDNLSRVSISV